MGWRGINIEASPRIFQRLVLNRPGSINLNLALAEMNGRAPFHDVDSESGYADGKGALEHTPEHLAEFRRNECAVVRIEVDTRTYRDVVADYAVPRVDLFVLDVVGCELRVIDGMRGSQVMPSVMCVQLAMRDAMKAALSELGYTFDFAYAVYGFFHRDGWQP